MKKHTLETLHQLSLKQLVPFLMLLVLIAVTGSAASDMYVPSLPHIAKYFNTTSDLAKLTITFYMFGFATAQLLWGTLADTYGRKKILVTGISVGLLGSLLCVFAINIDMLLIGRLIQGIGVAVTITLVRTMFRDVLKGRMLADALGYLSLIFSFTPAIAPIVGSYLQHYFSWRSVFIFITIYMIMVLVIAFIIPETCAQEHRHPLNLKQSIKDYGSTLKNKQFVIGFISTGCAIAGIMTYAAITPFLFQNKMGLSVIEYGWLTVFVLAILLLGRGLNIALLKKKTTHTLMAAGRTIMLIGGLLMLLFYFVGFFNVYVVLGPYLIFLLGTGFIFANAAVLAFEAFKTKFGIVGAMYGTLQLLIAFAVSYIAAKVPEQTQLSFAIILTCLALVTIGVGFKRKNKSASPSPQDP